MAVALQTIEEYILKSGKDFGFWMVFHTGYNDAYALQNNVDSELLVSKELIDHEKRDDFLDFMRQNFPNAKLTRVFDLFSPDFIIFPYLGSIAIDCDKDDDVFKAISDRYGNPFGETITNNAVFWTMKRDDAIAFDKQRKESLETELGDH